MEPDLNKYNTFDRQTQGSQGVQSHSNFVEEPASQVSALMNIRENQFDDQLRQLYYSSKCSLFYYAMLGVSLMLIVVTILDGYVIAESFLFIALECVVNFMITCDFLARLKLYGICKFLVKSSGQPNLWNLFDLTVVVSCNVLFLVAVFMQHGPLKNIDETMEQVVMLVWCIWQIFRLALIAKKQQQARTNAMTLINFENIVVDTEFGTHKSIHLEDQDEVVFQSMATESDASKSKVRNRRSVVQKQTELKEFKPRQKEPIEAPSPRVVVFEDDEL